MNVLIHSSNVIDSGLDHSAVSLVFLLISVSLQFCLSCYLWVIHHLYFIYLILLFTIRALITLIIWQRFSFTQVGRLSRGTSFTDTNWAFIFRIQGIFFPWLLCESLSFIWELFFFFNLITTLWFLSKLIYILKVHIRTLTYICFWANETRTYLVVEIIVVFAFLHLPFRWSLFFGTINLLWMLHWNLWNVWTHHNLFTLLIHIHIGQWLINHHITIINAPWIFTLELVLETFLVQLLAK